MKRKSAKKTSNFFWMSFSHIKCRSRADRIRLKKSIITGPDGDKFIVTISQDLTHIKAYQTELEREVSLKTKELISLNHVLEKLAVEDQLTNLYNRRKIDLLLSDEYKRYNRYKEVFSLIIGDIDHFKNVNDNFGHHKGGEVLIEVSNLIRQNIRKTDSVGRWGGEEFVVICPNSEETSAYEIAEKIRRTIESFNFIEDHNITCSFGVSDISMSNSIDQLIWKADNALYTAKEKGRNQVVLYNDRIEK